MSRSTRVWPPRVRRWPRAARHGATRPGLPLLPIVVMLVLPREAPAAENGFWLHNLIGEPVVSGVLAAAGQTGGAVEMLAEPLPPMAARWIAPPMRACRLEMRLVLQSGTVVPLAFDACRQTRVALLPPSRRAQGAPSPAAEPAPPPASPAEVERAGDPAALELIERLRPGAGTSTRGIRLPSPPAAPAPPSIEPISPWNLGPPDPGPRR